MYPCLISPSWRNCYWLVKKIIMTKVLLGWIVIIDILLCFTVWEVQYQHWTWYFIARTATSWHKNNAAFILHFSWETLEVGTKINKSNNPSFPKPTLVIYLATWKVSESPVDAHSFFFFLVEILAAVTEILWWLLSWYFKTWQRTIINFNNKQSKCTEPLIS